MWLTSCPNCGFLASTLWDAEVWTANADSLDETFRDSAFRNLRETNAEHILRKLNAIRSLKGLRLLDIGCGPGWFISAARRLGAVSVAIPSSRGVFYRVSGLLSRVGYQMPFERLWQKNCYTPHLSYFNPENLERFMKRNGFSLLHKSSVPALEVRGLWSRLIMDRTQSLPVCVAIWLLTVCASPALKFLPPDVIFHVYKKL